MINQTSCLMAEEGWRYMDIMDDWPVPIRERVRNSRFNICAACVNEKAWDLAREEAGTRWVTNPELRHYLKAIRNVEAEIDEMERAPQFVCEAA